MLSGLMKVGPDRIFFRRRGRGGEGMKASLSGIFGYVPAVCPIDLLWFIDIDSPGVVKHTYTRRTHTQRVLAPPHPRTP